MSRLDKNKKKLLVKMIRDRISINKISASLNLYKSTIYYYYKKINGKKYVEPKFNVAFSENEGEIVGIFAGDGSQYYFKPTGSYQTNVHFGSNLDYVHRVKALYESHFNRKWLLHAEFPKKHNIKYRLRTTNKKIFDYFSNYITYDAHRKHDTVKLNTLNLPIKFKIGFLRGLVDTDGTICNTKCGVVVAYYTTSKTMAKQIKILLNSLKLEVSFSRVIRKEKGWKDLYNVKVFQKDVHNFINLIKPYKAMRLGQ